MFLLWIRLAGAGAVPLLEQLVRDVHEGMRKVHEVVRDVHEGQQMLLNQFRRPNPKNGSE